MPTQAQPGRGSLRSRVATIRPTYVTNAPLCTGFSGTALTTAPLLPVERYVRYEYAPRHISLCGGLSEKLPHGIYEISHMAVGTAPPAL
jgi:hypothetical protein